MTTLEFTEEEMEFLLEIAQAEYVRAMESEKFQNAKFIEKIIETLGQ